jgi:microcystin-dependent protein
MSTPYVGEIRIVAFDFAPTGWAICSGQTLSVNQNIALFSLLGTYYGGNGVSTFKLPNFQGNAPVHQGGDFVLGEVGGETNHTLLENEMPYHTHPALAIAATGTSTKPSGNFIAEAAANARYTSLYTQSITVTPAPAGFLKNTGGAQYHNNMQPSLVVNFIIALNGIFPSRS